MAVLAPDPRLLRVDGSKHRRPIPKPAPDESAVAPARLYSMPTHARFPHLFAPIQLRTKTARNRLIVPAMATHFAEPDGTAGERLAAYLEARAQGGFGIVVTENIGVHPSGRVMVRMLMADDDSRVAGLARLAAAIRSHGALAIGQINHGGRQTSSHLTGEELVAPSAIPCPLMRELPRALSADEIPALQEAYVAAAARLEAAEFDGVEIHAAHGYLAASFLSAYSNRREDAYGGSPENRLRFLAEIVERIRARCGPDFLLFVRMSVEEFVPEGLVPEDVVTIARRLEAIGCDVISLSVGVYESYNHLTMLSGEPEAPWLDRAGVVRRAVGIPVVGVGRIKRPELAEAALAEGKIDLAAVGRGSITDPDFPNRLLRGLAPDTVACMSCNLCLGRSARPEMICPINPFVGRERDLAPPAPKQGGRLLVQGAGFAALTAAWLAARRGIEVALAHGTQPVGGMQAWRSRVPGQAEYAVAIRAVVERARAQGVEILSGSPDPAGFDIIWRERRLEPALTAGASASEGVVTAYAVLADTACPVAGRVLVVGEDLAASDAALLLAERGLAVTLRSPARDIAFDAHPGFRVLNRRLLLERGARIDVAVQDPCNDWLNFDAVVVGRIGAADPNDPGPWRSEWGDSSEAAIDDCYEPGAMAHSVYRAVSLAQSAPGRMAADAVTLAKQRC